MPGASRKCPAYHDQGPHTDHRQRLEHERRRPTRFGDAMLVRPDEQVAQRVGTVARDLGESNTRSENDDPEGDVSNARGHDDAARLTLHAQERRRSHAERKARDQAGQGEPSVATRCGDGLQVIDGEAGDDDEWQRKPPPVELSPTELRRDADEDCRRDQELSGDVHALQPIQPPASRHRRADGISRSTRGWSHFHPAA